jgi:hypothetical protein
MIAAIYARKSTDQNGIANDEKSVTRQIEHAKAYAAQNGWAVYDEYLYVDDGISGAEFVKRPGFLRLMNALKPKPAFQVLIMSEESRLGREQIETAYALKQIITAGVCASSITWRTGSAPWRARRTSSSSRSRPLRMKWNARRRANALTTPSCGRRERGMSRAVPCTVTTISR